MAEARTFPSIRILKSDATTPPESKISRAVAKKYISEGYLIGDPNRSTQIEAKALSLAIFQAVTTGLSRISLLNVEVRGKLDLGGATVHAPIQFTSCKFDSVIALTSAQMHLLRLDGCKIIGIDGRDARVDGSLVIAGSSVDGTIYLHNAQIAAILS